MEYKTQFKRWVVENGLTARKVAKDTGISARAVHSYMDGQRNPSRKNMKRFEEVYGVNARDLFPL